MTATTRFARYVAIGDSSTEGLDDPDGRGGYRGWANRLAERLAELQGGVVYANLGIRGRRTRQIRETQLAPALAMRPDLLSVFSGTNDVTSRRFDAAEVVRDMEAMQRAGIEAGATVLTFTLPDLTPVMPLARALRPRIAAMNDGLRAAARRTGTILVDFARVPVASDARLWSADRIHANAAGHARIAAALADALGLSGADRTWAEPLPAPPRTSRGVRLAREFAWSRQHLWPWLREALRDRGAVERREPKRPSPLPLRPGERA